jgi:LuxR family maltose regulon positive regulatory protein
MSRTTGTPSDGRAQVVSFPNPSAPAESDLRPPPARAGFVPRRELVETLMTSDADVITLTAPTGYGKTTTLAQWARVEMAPLAWLSLRRDDNHVKSFLSHLAASMRRAGVMTAEDVAIFQFMSDAAARSDGASHFANHLEAIGGGPLTVVIDNANLLRSRAAIDIVTDLVLQLEGRARFAFASNAAPKIRLSAIRARGSLLEITDEHLRFTVAEVEHLATRLGLDPMIAADIVESTEGWPAATFLTALAARDTQLDPAKSRIEGQRNLHEFVKSEIFPQLSKKRRMFLSRMSVLERMSGPLSDAVAGVDGSQRLLEALERDTQLIHHLDHDDTWFAMNRVLREALRAELEHREPETVRAVHSSAAAWYGANGMPVDAIGHALAAGDAGVFARLMERLIKDRYTSGHVGDVLMWMGWLEENVSLDDYPELAAIGALVHMQEDNVSETERWLDAASRGNGDSDTTAVISLVRAAATRTGVEQMVRDIEQAAEMAAPGSRWLPAILVVKGLAHLMDGDTGIAEAAFTEATKLGAETHSRASLVVALGQRALIAIGRQDWDLAGSLSGQALAIIDEFGLDGYHASGLALIAAARCARQNDDIPTVQRLLTRAARVRPRLGVAMPGEGVQILLEMARAHIELSDVAGARPLIREAQEIILQRPDLGLLPGQVKAIEESLAGLGPGKVALPALTKAELRVLPLLATHMSFPEIGEQLFVSRHTIKSQATSIYRKLGSSTRSEAIARAHEIGLLS